MTALSHYGVRYREHGVTAVAYVVGEDAWAVMLAFEQEYPQRRVIAVWSRGRIAS